MYLEGQTFQDLITWLLEKHGVQVAERTIRGRFKDWKVSRKLSYEQEQQMIPIIKTLFFELGLNDKEMLIDLQRQGLYITQYALVRLRFKLGLRRRIRDPEQRREAEERVRALIEDGLQTGAIEG